MTRMTENLHKHAPYEKWKTDAQSNKFFSSDITWDLMLENETQA